MWVISQKRLRDFWATHTASQIPLQAWYALTVAADWRNFSQLRVMFPAADQVGNCIVFNIGGNKFRLIARIFYRSHKLYVLRVMTHAEYDRDDWPKECGCYSKPPARQRRTNRADKKRSATTRKEKPT